MVPSLPVHCILIYLITTLSRTGGATISIGGLRVLHQGHVHLSLPKNSIANLRAQILWPCHKKNTIIIVHSYTPRLGNGITCDLGSLTTFCGITSDREGKGWEGVGSRVGPGDHVLLWLLHVATCLSRSGLGGTCAVYSSWSTHVHA